MIVLLPLSTPHPLMSMPFFQCFNDFHGPLSQEIEKNIEIIIRVNLLKLFRIELMRARTRRMKIVPSIQVGCTLTMILYLYSIVTLLSITKLFLLQELLTFKLKYDLIL